MNTDLRSIMADIQDRIDRSPHACVCGVKVLYAGILCDPCSEKRATERAIAERVELTTSTIPARYRWATFEASELAQRVRDPSALQKAKAAAVAGIDRVVLVGAAGRGKTVLSCCMLRALAPDMPGMFVPAIDLAIARGHEKLGHEAPLVAKALETPLLVLDDLGAEKPTALSAIDEVIHTRHAQMRPTIVTTGFSRQGLVTRYGDGIARRVREHAVIIQVGAPQETTE